MVRQAHKREHYSDNSTGQAQKREASGSVTEFGARLAEALGSTPVAEAARTLGLSRTTLDGYLKGHMPAADRALSLADALGVSPRWLISGQGERSQVTTFDRLKAGIAKYRDAISAGGHLMDASAADWVMLPRFDLFSWNDDGKVDIIEMVPFRRDWLSRYLFTSSGLWLTTMPSDAMPSIAREGDLIICKQIEHQLVDGRTYIFRLGGSPIIRRVAIRPEGYVLSTGDGSAEQLVVPRDADPGDVDLPHAVGRVLAAVAVRPV